MNKKLRLKSEISVDGIPLLEILKNHKRWIETNEKDGIRANLSKVDLSDADLSDTDFRGARLISTDFHGSDVSVSDFRNADIIDAKLYCCNLYQTIFIGTNAVGVNFAYSNLIEATFTNAILQGAVFQGCDLRNSFMHDCVLVDANFREADLEGSYIFGISAWRVALEGANQRNLIITRMDEPIITVDNMEVAQFIYLLINNGKIREVIDTITSKVVLILGRFTDERKSVLNAIKDKLRYCNYLPVLFDFEKPLSKNFIETVSTLAHMARFVIADVTDPKIVLHEIPEIVKNVAVPLVPIMLEESGREPVTLGDLRVNHRSLTDTQLYKSESHLVDKLLNGIIELAESKYKELRDISTDH